MVITMTKDTSTITTMNTSMGIITITNMAMIIIMETMITATGTNITRMDCTITGKDRLAAWCRA